MNTDPIPHPAENDETAIPWGRQDEIRQGAEDEIATLLPPAVENDAGSRLREDVGRWSKTAVSGSFPRASSSTSKAGSLARARAAGGQPMPPAPPDGLRATGCIATLTTQPATEHIRVTPPGGSDA